MSAKYHKIFFNKSPISAEPIHFFITANNRSIKLWNLSNYNFLINILGHAGGINDVCFSPDGNFILSGSNDKSIKLWQLIWDYEMPDQLDWHEEARPYLKIFLENHRRYIPNSFTKIGKPVWNDNEFNKFYEDLQNRDFGWLCKNGVRAETEKMTREYEC